VLVGTTKALAYAIHDMTVLKRNTKLRERLNPSLRQNATATAPRIVSYPEISDASALMVAEDRKPYNQ
jgi:exodeoxyribonuclease V alpha subunit